QAHAASYHHEINRSRGQGLEDCRRSSGRTPKPLHEIDPTVVSRGWSDVSPWLQDWRENGEGPRRRLLPLTRNENTALRVCSPQPRQSRATTPLQDPRPRTPSARRQG